MKKIMLFSIMLYVIFYSGCRMPYVYQKWDVADIPKLEDIRIIEVFENGNALVTPGYIRDFYELCLESQTPVDMSIEQYCKEKTQGYLLTQYKHYSEYGNNFLVRREMITEYNMMKGEVNKERKY